MIQSPQTHGISQQLLLQLKQAGAKATIDSVGASRTDLFVLWNYGSNSWNQNSCKNS